MLVRAVRRPRARGHPALRLRRHLQQVRHRQGPRARQLQNQMQTRPTPPRHAAEEATPRGAQAQDPALPRRAPQGPPLPRAGDPAQGGDRDACLTDGPLNPSLCATPPRSRTSLW